MIKSQKHTIAFICNIVITVLCILSIAAYFFIPFWKISLNAHIDEDAFEKILEDADVETDELEFEYHEILGENGLDFTFALTFKTQDILGSLGANPKDNVSALVASNIDNLDGPINTIRSAHKRFVTISAEDTLDEAIMEQMKTVHPEKTEEEIRDILEDAGVDNELIETEVERFVELFDSNTATADDIVAETFLIVDDVCEVLIEHEYVSFMDENKVNEAKRKVEEIVRDAIEKLENDDGVLSLDDLLISYLSAYLDEELSVPNTNAPLSAKTPSARSTTTNKTRTTSDAIEDLKDDLYAELMDSVDLETAKLITKIMNVIAYAILFTFFTWIYLIIKILAKLTKPNNTIRLGLPIGLGWLPCLILVFIPNLAMSSILGALDFDLPFTFSVTFTSGSVVSFGVAIALLLFSIFYYGKLRKQLALENCPTVDDPIPSTEPIQNEYNATDDPNAYTQNGTYAQNGYNPNAYTQNGTYAQNGYNPNAYAQNGTYAQNGYNPNAYAQNDTYAPNGYAANTYNPNGAYAQNGYAPNAYDPNGAYVQNGYAPTQNLASNEQTEQIEQTDHTENEQQQ